MIKKALRRCLYRECRQYFQSSSPAERICPKCRKKHKARLKGAAGMDIIPMTPAMSRHIESVETYGSRGYKDPCEKFEKDVDSFMSDEKKKEFDDSKIYADIAANEEDFDYDKEEIKKEKITTDKLSKQIKKVKFTKDELFEF